MSNSIISETERSSASLLSHESKSTYKNISRMREKCKANIYPKGFIYQPKVSEKFLEEWLDFPTKHTNVILNIFRLPFIWLLVTNKSMAGLDPSTTTIRERLCNQSAVLGTAAGLFLVIAIAGYLAPPHAKNEDDQMLVDTYGIMMFTASVCLCMYIGLSLTNLYPLIQSLRDDVAFDSFEVYMSRWGGYELYLFNIGFQFILFGLLVGCRVIYSDNIVYVLVAIFAAVYGVVVFLSKEMFLSFDPITAMHLGLSSDPNDLYRAEMMAHYLLKTIPNSIISEKDGSQHKVFHDWHQSEETRSSARTVDLQEQEEELVLPSYQNCSTANEQLLSVDSQSAAVSHSPNTTTGQRFCSYSQQQKQQTITESVKPRSKSSTMPHKQRTAPPPSFDSLFKGESCLLTSTGATVEDVALVCERLSKARCASSMDLVLLLDECKAASSCTCGASQEGVLTGSQHLEHCDSRRSGLWLNSLVALDIPTFTALKIVSMLKPHLK